jgi:hypothetical protein
LRNRECLAPSAHSRVVWRREIKTKQPKKERDQPFGLAEPQAETAIAGVGGSKAARPRSTSSW